MCIDGNHIVLFIKRVLLKHKTFGQKYAYTENSQVGIMILSEIAYLALFLRLKA